jgi:hypothetical protein
MRDTDRAPSRAELLRLVERSPACVAAHDREGWLALFAPGAVVSDPVGAAPHRQGAAVRRGRDALGRFWDTFIARNQIRFEVRADFVAGWEVARDVRIHTRLPNGFAIEVPAHLRYELAAAPAAPGAGGEGRQGDGRGLRIAALSAHWEARRLSAKALRGGWRGLTGVTALSGRMLRLQGPRGVAGYLRALTRGAFARGHEAAEAVGAALATGDEAALRARLTDDARLEWPAGRAVTPAELAAGLGGPPAALAIGPPIAAGWTASFRFVAGAGAARREGLAFLDLAPRTARVARARFFLAD